MELAIVRAKILSLFIYVQNVNFFFFFYFQSKSDFFLSSDKVSDLKYHMLFTCRIAENKRSKMALTWTHKDREEIRVHESLEELSIDLVDYIAEISEASIKEHGAFCIVLSGGSLISLMG